jgi:hypothetical protein
MTYDHKCGICGADNAPFGFGFAGHRSKLPAEKRGILWACGDHIADAERRWKGANAGPIATGHDAGAIVGDGSEQGRKQRGAAGGAGGKRGVTTPNIKQGALDL